jgi:hypothetical protein
LLLPSITAMRITGILPSFSFKSIITCGSHSMLACHRKLLKGYQLTYKSLISTNSLTLLMRRKTTIHSVQSFKYFRQFYTSMTYLCDSARFYICCFKAANRPVGLLILPSVADYFFETTMLGVSSLLQHRQICRVTARFTIH